MAAASFENSGVAVGVDSVDLLEESSDRFEGDAEVDVLSVGDAALYASGMVGGSRYGAVVGDEIVDHLRTASRAAVEAHSVVEALGSVDR